MPLFPAIACVLVVTIGMVIGERVGWFPVVTNFEGRPVGAAGTALAAGLFIGLALRMVDGDPLAPAMLLATTGFAAVGAADDRWGDRSATGLRGHLRAAASGRFTTGFWKVAGGGLTALLAAWLLEPPRDARGWALWLARAAVIALAANAVNLLDTRPVRAVVVFLALAVSTAAVARGGTLWVAVAGAAAFLPWDRSRRAMLGDAGSNVLGAAWAVAFASRAGAAAVLIALALLVALHAYTESHSLNREIAARPWLARLDAALRGPAPAEEE
jgi:hypothetical protein